MGYELKDEDIYGLTRQLTEDCHEKGRELFYKYCPYCNGGDSRDKDTFSINLDTGAYKCFRASCGAHGHFVEMARDFRYHLDGLGDSRSRKQYRTFPRQEIVTKQAAIDYMASRGISEEVTRRYRLTVRKDDPNILVFPFCDENGDVRFIKYRKTNFDKTRDKNKEWCEKNTEPILFGIQQCRNFEQLIITEGQIDSLSVAEAGFDNAVSVPTGAMGFTWLDNDRAFDWVHKFKRVIVFGDYENGQMSLLKTLSARLMLPVYHVRYEDYLGEKDANDILRKYGAKAVRACIENAVPCETPHIKRLSEVESVDLNALPKIKTNIRELDKVIGGLVFGQVILLSGKRGEGKSTFMSQLCAEALDQDVPFFAYSGELTDYHFKSWLDMQLAGGENISSCLNEYGDEHYFLRDEISTRISAWYADRAYIYDNAYVDNDELSGVIEAAELAIRRYGVKLVCVDNLMTALDIDPQSDLYRAQSDFVKRLKRLALKYDVAVILVAHPKKSREDFSNDTVSGSSDITNAVDVVLNYQRAAKDSGYDSILTCTKNRIGGKLITNDAPVQLYYSDKSKRIISDSGDKSRRYGCFAADNAAPDRTPVTSWEEDYFA